MPLSPAELATRFGGTVSRIGYSRLVLSAPAFAEGTPEAACWARIVDAMERNGVSWDEAGSTEGGITSRRGHWPGGAAAWTEYQRAVASEATSSWHASVALTGEDIDVTGTPSPGIGPIIGLALALLAVLLTAGGRKSKR